VVAEEAGLQQLDKVEANLAEGLSRKQAARELRATRRGKKRILEKPESKRVNSPVRVVDGSASAMESSGDHEESLYDSSSCAMSSFDSESSRVNFWKDINTKDGEYANAVFLKDTQYNTMVSEQTEQAPESNDIEKNQRQKTDLKARAHMNQQARKDNKEL
jgi:hypothetical protein